MIASSLAAFLLSTPVVLGCMPMKRSEVGEAPKWNYEATADWGIIDPEYELCQTGTQQSPIHLRVDQGLSGHHKIFFDYSRNVTGALENGGYGPTFKLHHPENDYTTLPSMTFEQDGLNETVYLYGWHTHAPGEHLVSNVRTKVELHFVHVNEKGDYRAVVGFRVDPGNEDFDSAFFGQLPAYLAPKADAGIVTTIDPSLAVEEVNHLKEFWTYQGSLTAPPCTEGLRWFVAREILYVSDVQMQDLLKVSAYSAREEQEVWRHGINA